MCAVGEDGNDKEAYVKLCFPELHKHICHSCEEKKKYGPSSFYILNSVKKKDRLDS
jgi:hypothetical protein